MSQQDDRKGLGSDFLNDNIPTRSAFRLRFETRHPARDEARRGFRISSE